jgi:hypothetical protein
MASPSGVHPAARCFKKSGFHDPLFPHFFELLHHPRRAATFLELNPVSCQARILALSSILSV